MRGSNSSLEVDIKLKLKGVLLENLTNDDQAKLP